MNRPALVKFFIIIFALYAGWYFFFSNFTSLKPLEPDVSIIGLPIVSVVKDAQNKEIQPPIIVDPPSISSAPPNNTVKVSVVPKRKDVVNKQLQKNEVEFFTIQISSSIKLDDAERDFQRVLDVLEGKERDELRIEYVQKYYTVRFGKFQNKASGAKLLSKVLPFYASARLFSAYILPKRIKKTFTEKSSPKDTRHQLDQLESNPVLESLNSDNSSLELKDVELHGVEKDSEKIEEVTSLPISPVEKVLVRDAANKIAEKKDVAQKMPLLSAEFLLMINKDDRGEKIQSPMDLFFDKSTDELYLVEAARQRVIIYGSDYFPQTSLGIKREIISPYSGVVGPQGDIYVCQRLTANKEPHLTILNAAFLLKKQIEYRSIKGAEKFTAQTCAIGKFGKIYLVGVTDRQVLVLDNNGKFIKWLEIADKKGNSTAINDNELQEKEKKLVLIRNITTDSEGNIFFLSEETSTIYVYNSEEKPLFTFGKKGGGPRKLSRPRSISIDEELRCIYVVDYMRHTVVVFDINGKVILEIGGKGSGPGWFNFPVDGQVGSQHQLIVADYFNSRLQVFEIKATRSLPQKDHDLWG